MTVPRGARIADALTALLLLAAGWIALTGGARYIVGGVVLPLRSAAVMLFTAAALQLLRHVVWPSPSLAARLRAADEAVAARPAVAAALRAFLSTRALVLVVALMAVITIGPPAGMKGDVRVSNNAFVNLPSRFDAGWYGGIALYGYSWSHSFDRQQAIAFFPALPVLARGAGMLLGSEGRGVPRESRMARVLWGGTLVSLAAFLGGLVYLARFAADHVGDARAGDAVLLLAAYPFSVFYSAPYTEGLFLLGAAGAAWHFRREQWGRSAMWGVLAGLSRPNGCFLSLPLALLVLQELRARPGMAPREAAIRLAAAAAPGAGMLLFTGYLYALTGVPFAWARSHAAWGRTFEGFAPIGDALSGLVTRPFMDTLTNMPYQSLNTAGLLFACALLPAVWRRVGAAWAVFIAVNVASPLLAGGVLSMGRLTSTLFPLFVALAAVLPPRAVAPCAAAFALFQGLAAALFFTWRDLY